jgi:hypothetical protein
MDSSRFDSFIVYVSKMIEKFSQKAIDEDQKISKGFVCQPSADATLNFDTPKSNLTSELQMKEELILNNNMNSFVLVKYDLLQQLL